MTTPDSPTDAFNGALDAACPPRREAHGCTLRAPISAQISTVVS